MLLIHAFHSRLNAHWLFWVWQMPFILPHTMLVAHFSNNFLSVLVVPLHRPMHLGVVALQVWCLAACKWFHTFPSLLAGTMVIPITIVALIVCTKPLAILTANHTLRGSLLNSNQLSQCIMVVHLPSEATGELDHNNRTKPVQWVPSHMLALLHSQCKVWFPVNL
jgi:hypothetical protein